MTQNVMYHYTNPQGWHSITNGNPERRHVDPRTGEFVDDKDVRGLWPGRRLINPGPGAENLPAMAKAKYIWGLHEPEPAAWVDRQKQLFMFEELMRNCAAYGRLTLLKVHLTSAEDPHVLEYGHRHPPTDPELFAEGNRKYWESRVPLAAYEGGYEYPEVIVSTPIPLEQIEFMWEKRLETFLGDVWVRSA
jgi:hypothetical protein